MHLATLTLCIVIVTIFIFLINLVIRYARIIKNIQQLPGPPSKNLLSGNISPLFDTPENIFKVVRKWGVDYYPIYKSWIAHVTAANVVNPHDFETILSNTKHTERSYVYDIMRGWLGSGLLISSGNKWHQRRKILTPSFHFSILQQFIKIFDDESKKLVEIFKRECHKPFINVTDYISAFALNTIAETAMGTNFDTETIREQKYKQAIHEIGDVFVYRFLRPWLLYKVLYFFNPHYWKEKALTKTLHQFTSEVIQKREKNFRPIEQIDQIDHDDVCYSKRKRLAMLDLLLSAKKEEGSIDDGGINEEVDTFMFAGHDTVSVAISYALMLIANHKEVQERIVEEMKLVLDSAPGLNYKTLQELKYLERCIKEVLRLYPSVPFISRVLGEDMTTYSGHHLKAGSMINLHIYDVHHNAEIYPDPEKFDPDRFLPENNKNRHNFAYVPFSAGVRNCIGQKFALLEIKTVLCTILSEFMLEPVDTPNSINLSLNLVLRTKDGIRVKFIPRQCGILSINKQ